MSLQTMVVGKEAIVGLLTGVRGHRTRTGTIVLDPRPLQPKDVPLIVAAIRAVYARARKSVV